MSDYIKREDAINWLRSLHDDCGNYMSLWHYGEALEKIVKLLSADVAPVVRCKDCVHCEKDTMFCTVFDKNRLENDFCSEGENNED